MRNLTLIVLLTTLISCTSQQDKDAPVERIVNEMPDSAKVAAEVNNNCDELQQEINRLNKVLSDYKRKDTQGKAEAIAKTHTPKVAEEKSATKTNTAAKSEKAAKPVVNDRDKNSSTRCKGMIGNERCSKRTFSSNGMCWQHGGNQ